MSAFFKDPSVADTEGVCTDYIKLPESIEISPEAEGYTPFGVDGRDAMDFLRNCLR